MSRIEERLRGKQRVEVFGALPETVLNAAALAAVELWDMECVNANTLRLSLYESELESFQGIVRRCMCEMTVLSSEGGSRDRALLRRRLPLIIAAAVTAVLLFLSSLFIWEIDVRGTEKLSRAKVLRALSQCGVESGSYWPALSSDLVRSEMTSLLPEIGWMTVNVCGSRATVLIAERQEKPEIYDSRSAADIVAARTGIIKRLSVRNGKAAAAAGDAVTEGELLVSGAMDSIANGTRYVRASACAMADTWYELCAASPSKELEKEAASFGHSRFAAVVGKRRINLYLSSGKAIDGCDKIVYEYKLGIEGLFAMPLKLVREELISYRLSETEMPLSPGTRERLEESLRARVKGEVLQLGFTEAASGGLNTLTLRAHCLEDIGRTVPIED